MDPSAGFQDCLEIGVPLEPLCPSYVSARTSSRIACFMLAVLSHPSENDRYMCFPSQADRAMVCARASEFKSLKGSPEFKLLQRRS